jgi:probable F420-dependent oxidoreductase
MLSTGTRAEWHAKVREAEDLGFDILHVTDHLGMSAPFPALVSAAEATNLRVGPLVLNAGFYHAATLARDAIEADRLTDGRLQLGLGTGYLRDEFEAVGARFPSGGQRVEGLERLVIGLREAVATVPPHLPASLAKLNTYRRTLPPLLIAGIGERLLRVAGNHADIVQFQAMRPGAPAVTANDFLADRIDIVRQAAGERFQQLELSVFTFAVCTSNGTLNLQSAREFVGHDVLDEDILRIPGVLAGSVGQIVETLLERREKLGITYLTVLENDMHAFSKVITKLR